MLLPGVMILLSLIAAPPAFGQKRLLHLGHSAGFRHDSVRTSARALELIGERTGKFQVTAIEDLAYITAERLREFDAVFFFTSGELPLTDAQKQDLLDFVRSGKGFGGAHSATDTLYLWPEYGELIGGYFDGHPWVKEVRIDIEDPDFPGHKEFAPNFQIVDEIYQFRTFSRDRVRVLATLDTSTVDLGAAGVNRTDGDFALSWIRKYGEGRVFYTALGHFEETWLDSRFQKMIEGALLWMIGEAEADATPRPSNRLPLITAVQNPIGPASAFAPGSVIAIYGEGLTSGSTFAAPGPQLPTKIAGAQAEWNGRPLPLFYASPGQMNALLPFDIGDGPGLRVTRAGVASQPVALSIVERSPALIAARREGAQLALYVTGLGKGTPVPFVERDGFRETAVEMSTPAPGVWRLAIGSPSPGASVRVWAGDSPSNSVVVD